MKRLLIILLLVCLFSCSDDGKASDPILAEDTTFFNDGEMQVLFENDPNGINFIFLGDGYINEDLGKLYGSYRLDAERHINYLINTFPFSEFQQNINAYIIYAKSESSENTVFDVQYSTNDFGLNNPASWDGIKINNYIENAFPNLMQHYTVMLSINNRGGGRALIGGDLALFGSFSEDTMVHEIGHAFGGLADEYFFEGNSEVYNTDFVPNLDNTNDLDQVKWSHFIGHAGYSNVGAYEGGGYTDTNIWRPQQFSIMGGGNSSNFSEDFNAPSREAIVKRIYDIKNLDYSFQDFLTIDQQFLSRESTNNRIHATISCGNSSSRN